MTVLKNTLAYQSVSNAGIVLWNGSSGLGVDLFCCDKNQIYRDTDPNLRIMLFERIAKGDMKAMVITHAHSDHFLAEDVIRAWQSYPEMIIFTTNEVKARLRSSIDPGKLIVPESVPYVPEWFCVGGYKIGLMITRHEGAQYADVSNLAVLVETGRNKAVITGDALPDVCLLEAISGWERSLDLLIVPFPLVGLKKNRRLLTAYLDIKNIFAYHLPKENVNVNWVLGAKAVCSSVDDGLVYPVFAEIMGKWYRIRQ